MKKAIVLATVVVGSHLWTDPVSAKGIAGKGVKGGLALATMVGKDMEEADRNTGVILGGYITYDVNDKLSLQPEIFYSQKGYRIDQSESFFGATMSVKGTTSLNYLEVPLLGVYTVHDRLRLFAGPSVGLYLNGKTEAEISFAGESESMSEDINSDSVTSPDIGWVVGGLFDVGKITVEGRYSAGISSVPSGDEASDMKHQVIQLMVGYPF
ncbi:MAG: porin family protein [Fidelibacterota bacterium]